ncbi:hypothetical protein PR048_011916 [Dryococelus australis]|uniref:MADF domain-containing protein n=1 Tax=Dryococelus australis TaxID=614101 RepID=A0ABQ9HMZ3_9NEOP|nr:hypothetical protein PR048_011916 [Dryococelus australis]
MRASPRAVVAFIQLRLPRAATNSHCRAGRQAARRVRVHSCACPRSDKLAVSGRTALAECGPLFTVEMSAEFVMHCDILITLVQERPVLWDKTTEKYKDRQLILEAWKEVYSLLKKRF